MPKRKKLTGGVTKAPKGVAGMGSLMSQGMSATAARNLMNKIRKNKPTGRISQLDIKKAKDMIEKKPRKMPNPKDPGTRMNKEPRKMPNPKTLGPLRPIAPRTRKNQLERLMEKGPRPMGRPEKQRPKGLGPLRPIRERARQSRLVGGKSTMRKPKR